MKFRHLSLPLLLSFNELALVAVFGITFAMITVSTRLSGTQQTLWDADAEIRRLKIELAKSEAEKTRLADELAKSVAERTRLADELAKSEAEKTRLAVEFAKLEAERTRLAGELAKFDANVKRLVSLLTKFEGDLNKAVLDRDEALKRLADLLKREPGVHQQLLGLEGKLDYVVIVLDRSGSMAREGRWDHVQQVVLTWVKHLKIKTCSLVTFSADAAVFSEQGKTVFPLDGAEGSTNKGQLMAHIKGITPSGGTNTLDALTKAYHLASDGRETPGTILLFTDGEPNNGQAAAFDPQVEQQIYTLCDTLKAHKVVVNTVGLGEYFDLALGRFLRRVAQLTGGTFLGR